MIRAENFPNTMALLEQYAVDLERDLRAGMPILTGQLCGTLKINFFANECEYLAQIQDYAQWLKNRRKRPPKNPKITHTNAILVMSSTAFTDFKPSSEANNPVPMREALNLIDKGAFTRKYRFIPQRIKVLKDKLAIALKKDVEALALKGLSLPSRFSLY